MKKIKSLIKKAIDLAHYSTSILDRKYYKESLEPQWPPIFVIGPPRSGTSLLHQILINTSEFAYLPNIANFFYMCPITAIKLGLKFCPKYISTYKSRYGFEKGCLAPSEAGNIWNRWFPQEKRDGFNYTPGGYLSDKEKNIIRQLIYNLETIFSAPFLTKNAKMAVRLPVLYEIFPKALFIQIKRNPVDSALSILLRRRKYNLDWWSVMPKEYQEFKNLPDIEQVCRQVYFIEKNIEDDIQLFNPSQRHVTHYDSLCDNPKNELKKIHNFLATNGISVDVKYDKLPPSFPASKPKIDNWVSEEEFEKIKKIIKNLYQSIKIN